MHKNIIKIRKESKEYLIFTKEGMLLSLDEEEFKLFEKYGKARKINISHKEFLGKLASYGILEFEGFKPEMNKRGVKKEYDLSLKEHNSSFPLYPSPVLAHLAITNKCNMQCRYCSVRKLHHINNKELSTDEWKKIIEKLADWGVFQIGFTGGEPTLRKDLLELIRFAHEQRCVCNLTTNGWFLVEALVEKLFDAGMKQCQVSLDSNIQEIHEKLRGKGSFKKVIKSVVLLKKKGIAVGIDCVVSKNNIRFIPELIRWIEKNKIPYLTLIKLKKGDLSDKDYKELAPGYKEYSDLIKYICKRKPNENPNITLDCSSVANLQAVADKGKLLNIPVAGCPLGHYLICSSPNGDIYPCAALLDSRFRLGNLLKDDLKKVWCNNTILKNLRLIKQKITGECKNCDRLDLCRGGCRGIVFSKTANLFGSDYSCKYLKGGK